MKAMLSNVSVYYTAFKTTLVATLASGSADPPGTMFVKLLCEKYLLCMNKYIMVIQLVHANGIGLVGCSVNCYSCRTSTYIPQLAATNVFFF